MKIKHILAATLAATALVACSSVKEPKPQVQEVITVTQTSYFNSVWFANNTAKVDGSFDAIIGLNADYLIANPMAQIQIQGYASEVGSKEHNQKLGLERANAVKKLFVAAGVNPNQIQVVSFGFSRLLFPESNKQHSPQNRRADIVYVSGAPLAYYIDTLPIVTTENESVTFDDRNIKGTTDAVRPYDPVKDASAPLAQTTVSSNNASAPVSK